MPSDTPATPQHEPRSRFRQSLDLTYAGLLALVLLYLATVIPSLGNDPIAGGDEGWIMSSAARLARDGIFGSDLFAGFYGAEDYYFFNLPLHHLILAGVFKVFGVSLTIARAVSVLFGLAALLLTFALGRRIGGPAASLGAAALLVLLRLNLTPFSGLTLTDLGATVRYDLITLPFSLGAVLLILRRNANPTPTHIALAGLLIGLGALTQFIGAFVGVPIALFLLLTTPGWKLRVQRVALLTAMAALPFIPYFVYIGAHWEDFQGQARAVEQGTSFFSPSFYVDQLRGEADRYALSTGLDNGLSSFTDRVSARLVMLVVGPIALACTLWRGRRDPARLLLGLLIAALLVELALFESTKRFVYWVVVTPYVCVAIADLAVAAWQAVQPQRRQLLLRGGVALVAALFLLEGLAVAARDIRNAPDAPSYAALDRRLEAALPAGAVVIGDNRLWPALDHGGLRSLLLLFYHTNPVISEGRATDIPGAFDRIGAEYLLLSPLGYEILSQLSPEDTRDFDAFMAERAILVETIEDRAYGPIEVYRLAPPGR